MVRMPEAPGSNLGMATSVIRLSSSPASVTEPEPAKKCRFDRNSCQKRAKTLPEPGNPKNQNFDDVTFPMSALRSRAKDPESRHI